MKLILKCGWLKLIEGIFVTLILAVCFYVFTAWAAFQYRNPKSNGMSFYRHFHEVIAFEKLEEYE